MTLIAQSWLFRAVLAAVFAAATALTAKVGVAGIDPDLATWIRTMVVAIVLAALQLGQAGQVAPVDKLSVVFVAVRCPHADTDLSI